MTYCSHVTVLVLCSAYSGDSADHGIKYEIAWDACILNDQRRRSMPAEQ
ncbi:hypothetical protein OG800_50490 (plasmid) [Streptomyces sp. NBC_00445]